MKKIYNVLVSVSGRQTYEVEASSEAEAKEMIMNGECDNPREDLDYYVESAEEI